MATGKKLAKQRPAFFGAEDEVVEELLVARHEWVFVSVSPAVLGVWRQWYPVADATGKDVLPSGQSHTQFGRIKY